MSTHAGTTSLLTLLGPRINTHWVSRQHMDMDMVDMDMDMVMDMVICSLATLSALFQNPESKWGAVGRDLYARAQESRIQNPESRIQMGGLSDAI